MLMSMEEIAVKYGNIRSVIHVGAHHGQEVAAYKTAGARQIDLFEPLASNVAVLNARFAVDPDISVHHTALGDYDGQAVMWVASNEGQSSSILMPSMHLTQYPHITFQTSETVPVKRLDDFGFLGADFLAMDVQGYELEVLRGARKTLDNVRMVYCEVNRAEVYENCARVEQLDAFLAEWGFTRVDTDWVGDTWGDALFVRV
jgi:FkbM family methyltransferase